MNGSQKYRVSLSGVMCAEAQFACSRICGSKWGTVVYNE